MSPLTLTAVDIARSQRWPEKQAWEWHQATPWLVGCNYLPRHASNQLEMWQAATFDPVMIDQELGWLAKWGMNSLRVFLHDLLWFQDRAGFLARMGQFLDIAARHGMGVMFVFFDSCWYPFPSLGPQRPPEPGVHNSFWAQSPGVPILRDAAAFDRLEEYVTGVVRHFANDARVQVWDVWNEPENANDSSFGPRDLGAKKAEIVLPLLAETFGWIRAGKPAAPITACVWRWESGQELDEPLGRFRLEASDVISFHCYQTLEKTRAVVDRLKTLGRPLLCTEYLARGQGNTMAKLLPYFRQEKIGAYNWGAVSGRSQTIYPWDSWQHPYATEPSPWQHDLLRSDGAPYDSEEAGIMRALTKEVSITAE